MKHQYFGDVNDYRKYGLLRSLVSAPRFSLGVSWLLTPDDGSTDGKFRNYLHDVARFRHYDPTLFDALSRLRDPSITRSVANVEAWNLLPGARYFSEPVPDDGAGRVLHSNRALSALEGADLIFFDPDNGIEVKSVRFGARGSSKYVYWRELADAYNRGSSVIVYQHFQRTPRDQFLMNLARKLSNWLLGASVRTYRTAHAAFLLASQPRHESLLRDSDDILASTWRDQISPFNCCLS